MELRSKSYFKPSAQVGGWARVGMGVVRVEHGIPHSPFSRVVWAHAGPEWEVPAGARTVLRRRAERREEDCQLADLCARAVDWQMPPAQQKCSLSAGLARKCDNPVPQRTGARRP